METLPSRRIRYSGWSPLFLVGLVDLVPPSETGQGWGSIWKRWKDGQHPLSHCRGHGPQQSGEDFPIQRRDDAVAYQVSNSRAGGNLSRPNLLAKPGHALFALRCEADRFRECCSAGGLRIDDNRVPTKRILRIDVYPSHSVLQGTITLVLAGGYLFAVGMLAQFVAYLGGAGSFRIQAFLVLLAIVMSLRSPAFGTS